MSTEAPNTTNPVIENSRSAQSSSGRNDLDCKSFPLRSNPHDRILVVSGELGVRCGMTIERSEITRALVHLLDQGSAKAFWRLTTKPVEELHGVPLRRV